MFKVHKSVNSPKSLKSLIAYDKEDVVTQLMEDCHGKCYICGDKIEKDLRIEHFIPHEGNEDLKFDWKNLLLACDYCNSIKSNTYNKPGTELINPITENPGDFINHEVVVDKVKFNIRVSSKKYHKNTDATIELLEKVYLQNYNSSHANKIKQQILAKRFRKEFKSFIDILYIIYHEECEKNEMDIYKARLQDQLSDESPFVEFKREYYNQI